MPNGSPRETPNRMIRGTPLLGLTVVIIELVLALIPAAQAGVRANRFSANRMFRHAVGIIIIMVPLACMRMQGEKWRVAFDRLPPLEGDRYAPLALPHELDRTWKETLDKT